MTKRPVGLMWNLVFASDHFVRREDRIDDVLLHFGAQRFGGNVVVVLGGNDHGVDADRLAVVVFDTDLALAIGAEELELAGSANFAQLAARACAPA